MRIILYEKGGGCGLAQRQAAASHEESHGIRPRRHQVWDGGNKRVRTGRDARAAVAKTVCPLAAAPHRRVDSLERRPQPRRLRRTRYTRPVTPIGPTAAFPSATSAASAAVAEARRVSCCQPPQSTNNIKRVRCLLTRTPLAAPHQCRLIISAHRRRDHLLLIIIIIIIID